MSNRLTTWADEIVTEKRILVERMIIRPMSQHQFHVLGGVIKEGIIDIHNKTCSCRVFQLDQLVCAHGIVVYPIVQVDYISLCSNFYFKELLVMAYTQQVEPVCDMADWKIPAEIRDVKVNLLVEAPPPGHYLKLKIPSMRM